MIKTVTLTGADNSVTPEQLAEISKQYPFVEWAILVSRNNFGAPRWPSIDWFTGLFSVNKQFIEETGKPLNLALHLCGAYVRELLSGQSDFYYEVPGILMFQRVQINTHGQPHTIYLAELIKVLSSYPEKEFIFQYDNVEVHDNALRAASQSSNVKVSALFDLSHGAGVLPENWPELLQGIKCGYAGGLSPENVESQIQVIEEKVGDIPIWIDMETHIRSNDDRIFDLDKCKAVLEIAKKYVKA